MAKRLDVAIHARTNWRQFECVEGWMVLSRGTEFVWRDTDEYAHPSTFDNLELEYELDVCLMEDDTICDIYQLELLNHTDWARLDSFDLKLMYELVQDRKYVDEILLASIPDFEVNTVKRPFPLTRE